jgi:hypothetical protein
MPDREVNSIRDLIYYQYAKIIAKRAFATPSGTDAKRQHYGFIKNTFRDLKKGKKLWSDIIREDWQLVESEKQCIYCGSIENLHKEHIVPKSLNIVEKCKECNRIHGIHNQVWACEECNFSKGTLGLYEFYRKKYPEERKYYDFIPSLLEKKYLKTIYCCHECVGTLDRGDLDGDGDISVLDIDFILHS